MKKQLCLSGLLVLSVSTPAWGQRLESRSEVITLSERKKDLAGATLLSVIYPGAGQFYVGNNPTRSGLILGGGTLLLAGGAIGFASLADRPAESSLLGNLMIGGVLLGYYLWNIRDAYLQAEAYNMMLENENRMSMAPVGFSSMDSRSAFTTPALRWQTQF